MQDYGSFHFRSRCITFCTNDEKSWVRINYAVILQCVKILFFARFLRYLKIYMVNPLMTFLFSLLGNMLHSDTPLFVAIITEGCRIWEKNMASHPKILSIFTSWQHKLSPNVLSIYLSIIINGKYRMIAFNLYVLCTCILLSWHTNDIFFWGWQANFGTRISLSEAMSLKQINKTAVYLIMSVKQVFILLQRSDKDKG